MCVSYIEEQTARFLFLDRTWNAESAGYRLQPGYVVWLLLLQVDAD